MFFGLMGGDVTWPASATWILVATLSVVLVLGILLAVAISRARRRRSSVDGAATYMGKGRDLRRCRDRGEGDRQRLGVRLARRPHRHHGGRQADGLRSLGRHGVIIGVPAPGEDDRPGHPGHPSAPGAVSRRRTSATCSTRPATFGGHGAGVGVRSAGRRARRPTCGGGTRSATSSTTPAAKLAQHFASGTRAGALAPITTSTRKVRTSSPTCCSPRHWPSCRSRRCTPGSRCRSMRARRYTQGARLRPAGGCRGWSRDADRDATASTAPPRRWRRA